MYLFLESITKSTKEKGTYRRAFRPWTSIRSIRSLENKGINVDQKLLVSENIWVLKSRKTGFSSICFQLHVIYGDNKSG